MFQSRLFSGTSARSCKICGGNGYSFDEHAVEQQRHDNTVTCHLTFTAGVALLVRAGTDGSVNCKLVRLSRGGLHQATVLPPAFVNQMGQPHGIRSERPAAKLRSSTSTSRLAARISGQRELLP